MLKIGDKFPDFSLEGINGNGEHTKYTNQSFLGKKLVIYFYPKDDTPGCTKESCNFNDLLPRIKEKAYIVGVSKDGISSHQKFQQKYNLNFPLLVDEDMELAKKVESLKLGGLLMARTTFVVDEKGYVLKCFYGVNVEGHDLEILSVLS